MPSATDINNQFLTNNTGTLTQTLDPIATLLGSLLGAEEAEPTTVGPPPVRNVRREITRSRNRGGRQTARRAGQLFRNERRRELNFAERHQGRLERLIDKTAGMEEGNILLEKLNAQANTDLDAGRSLTAGENRTASQNSRGAYSARGLANSNPSAIAEVMERHQFGEQRYRERQRFAQGLVGQNYAKSAMYDPLGRLGLGTAADARSVYLPAMGMAQSIQNQDAAAQLGVTQQQASITSAESLQNANLGTQANLQSNNFAYDDYNTRLNALYGAQIGQLNAEAAQQAASSGLGGQIAGSALGAVGSIFGGGGGALLGGGGALFG